MVGGDGGALVGIKKLFLPQAGSNCELGKHDLVGEKTFSGMVGRGLSIGSTKPLSLLLTLAGCVCGIDESRVSSEPMASV